MRHFALLILIAACAHAEAPDAGQDVTATARAHYEEHKSALEAERQKLQVAFKLSKTKKDRAALLASARAMLYRSITEELIPAWLGTKWAYYGTSETPGEGSIACGYFVTTVLRDAGLHIERARLAQQASELIVKTFAAPSDIRRYRSGDVKEVVDGTVDQGDGLYVIGMDYHAALLDVHDGVARLCHSAVLAPGTVVCEPALTAEGMTSSYHVVGPVLTDAVLRAWLQGAAVPTGSSQ